MRLTFEWTTAFKDIGTYGWEMKRTSLVEITLIEILDSSYTTHAIKNNENLERNKNTKLWKKKQNKNEV